MITHDNDIASKADCVITIQDGLVVENFDSTKI